MPGVLVEQDIRTQTHTEERPSEDTRRRQPRSEASEETNPVDILTWDFLSLEL